MTTRMSSNVAHDNHTDTKGNSGFLVEMRQVVVINVSKKLHFFSIECTKMTTTETGGMSTAKIIIVV